MTAVAATIQTSTAPVTTAPLLRRVLGSTLRELRQTQRRTLREVSEEARVSLGYLSEVERGQKEASSELLASICAALGVRLADVLRQVSDEMALAERFPVAPTSLEITARAA
jgi:transcriptional regulator with XRE-family HTH domain